MLIGLTGKTGSGKSHAAMLFKKWGAYVIDCDTLAHDVLTFPSVIQKLLEAFGDTILSENKIDRKKLGKLVFSDSEKLKTLNSIVHPVIVEKALEMAENAKEKICIIDGSELELSKIDEKCKHIIVIKADENIRLKRILERDLLTPDVAKLRINAQTDYSKKAIVIENNSLPCDFEEKLRELYKKLMEESNA